MMTKRSPQFFKEVYLPTLASTICYATTARATGISSTLIFRWISESKKAADEAAKVPDAAISSPFYFEYEERIAWLHEHVKFIQFTVDNQLIESAARMRASGPITVPTYYKGQRVPARDPFLIGKPDLIDLLGRPDDLLRDKAGNVVWETQEIQPSTDLVALMMQSNIKKYRRSLKVDVDERISGGVMVISRDETKAVAAPVPVDVIEDLSKFGPELPPADFSELEPEAEDGPGDEPDLAVTATPIEPTEQEPAPAVVTQEPEPMIRTETPAEYRAPIDPLIAPRSLSAAERDLLRRK